MEPISTVLVILLTGGLLTAAWPWIIKYFSESIIPWIKKNLSEEIGSTIADILVYADMGVSSARRISKSMLKRFHTTLLGSTTRIEMKDANSATRVNTFTVQTETGAVRQFARTDKIKYEDIPANLRSEMLRQDKKTAEMDIKQAVLKKVEEKANEDGLLQELTA
jgi:hypothetical protein